MDNISQVINHVAYTNQYFDYDIKYQQFNKVTLPKSSNISNFLYNTLGISNDTIKMDLELDNKKGKVILPQQDRLRIVKALSIVDEACLAIDDDSSVKKTIESIALKNQQFNLIFANGGDRNQPSDIPEVDVCKEHKIELIFGAGGSTKRDSSTRINTELGIE